jgi:hypothetical protein
LKIALRASGSEDFLKNAIKQLAIADIVQLAPHIPYKMALQECADSDGLLLFQAKNCDHQIPAKAYEYLRLGKAIFALTTHTGDTAALLNEVGGATIAELADEQDIYQRFPSYLAALSSGTHPLPQQAVIQSYARRMQASQLAKRLRMVGERNFAMEKPQAPGLAGQDTAKLKIP